MYKILYYIYRWSFDFLSDNPSYDQQSNIISEFTLNKIKY